jgi:hypothetical protein
MAVGQQQQQQQQYQQQKMPYQRFLSPDMSVCRTCQEQHPLQAAPHPSLQQQQQQQMAR